MEQFNVDFMQLLITGQRYRNQLIACAVGVGLIIFGGFYYYHARAQENQVAQELLADLLADVEQAYQNGEWSDIEVVAQRAITKYKRSSLHPYFIAIYGEALANQQKIDESILLYDQAINALSHTSPFFFLYKTKVAQLRLASTNEQTQGLGFNQLESLATDQNNPQREYAQYCLALYFEQHNENDKAQVLWKELAKSGSSESPQDIGSAWTQVAKRYSVQGS